MRVAFVTHYGDYRYGANRSLVDLIDGLQAYGLEMLVIAPHAGSLVPALERRGIAVICHRYGWWMSPGRSKLRASARMLRGALSAAPLARRLKSWNCDIIHSNSSAIPMGWLLAAVTRRPLCMAYPRIRRP